MHKLIKEDSILRSFFNYLFVEKGLSSNTVNAYENDIYSFVSWVEKSKLDYLKLKEENINNYISYLFSSKLKSSSINLSLIHI